MDTTISELDKTAFLTVCVLHVCSTTALLALHCALRNDNDIGYAMENIPPTNGLFVLLDLSYQKSFPGPAAHGALCVVAIALWLRHFARPHSLVDLARRALSLRRAAPYGDVEHEP